jgi:polyphosphate glucokinase
VVDLDAGCLVQPRRRVDTPQPATPKNVAAAVKRLMARSHLREPALVGVGFPAVIKGRTAATAQNIDEAWLATDIVELLSKVAGRPVAVLNDADAAGLAEMRYGVGRGVAGVVAMITLGTGIGTALLVDGTLVPNTELGHLRIRGREAAQRAAASARDDGKLSWRRWARNVQEYLEALDRLIWPDLVIVGGGVSAEPEKFLPYIRIRPPVVAATLGNDAGIIGAALYALEADSKPTRVRGPFELAREDAPARGAKKKRED